ncbi:MAG: ribokinase [Clostridiales bacterium]|nr:ribokinase [Clostridiales bacterium]
MKRPRILVVGSFVMDLIFRADRFVSQGETILGTDFHSAPGGKGANQAVQAARLGAEVSMVGKVGDDGYGRAMLASLNEAGVGTEGVTVTKDCPSGLSNIQIRDDGAMAQNRILVIPGANMAIAPKDVAFLEREIAQYDMVVLQLEIPMEINELVARYARANGVPVMLNPAPAAELSSAFMKNLTYLAPNEHEAEALTGVQPKDEASIRHAAELLRQQGAQRVIITLGESGAAFWDGEHFLMSPAATCEHPVDPTAAGDSFIGAFSTAVCAGMRAEDAMAFANHTASLTVSGMGAQPSLPGLERVNASLAKAGRQTLHYDH